MCPYECRHCNFGPRSWNDWPFNWDAMRAYCPVCIRWVTPVVEPEPETATVANLNGAGRWDVEIGGAMWPADVGGES